MPSPMEVLGRVGTPNQVCGSIGASVMKGGIPGVKQGWPLFFSEFGVDQGGINTSDSRYLGCFLGLAAELDVDWALWTLQRKLLSKEGVLGMEGSMVLFSYSLVQGKELPPSCKGYQLCSLLFKVRGSLNHWNLKSLTNNY
ncbi:hypothetical protein HPP92_023844 [Vanilla planifolia]|uniref:Uncharacterized protein n=1 Tax=Vanilla planifolia TaxID=51239 RepID=A0A835UE53_VANPL|nr:hypothetical protein HPP92_023844 [Vanilla planifolia]